MGAIEQPGLLSVAQLFLRCLLQGDCDLYVDRDKQILTFASHAFGMTFLDCIVPESSLRPNDLWMLRLVVALCWCLPLLRLVGISDSWNSSATTCSSFRLAVCS